VKPQGNSNESEAQGQPGSSFSIRLANPVQQAKRWGLLLVVCMLSPSVFAAPGQPAVADSSNLATVDSRFIPDRYEWVRSLAVQVDGKILVGGLPTTQARQNRRGIGRLNADGSLDTSFNPGTNSDGSCFILQADGKILVGGWFTNLSGQVRYRIAPLNADGSLDPGFNPGTYDNSFTPGADDSIVCLAVQADGKILVGGEFYTLGRQSCKAIGRFNADGSLDTDFHPQATRDDQTRTEVKCLAVQGDGKIVVGGEFDKLGGRDRSRIGRLNPDGSLDTSFNADAGRPRVNCLAVQADGRILVGGEFETLNGQSRSGIGRLNADGSLDTEFNPGADWARVNSLAVQAGGKILVGGEFETLGGRSRSRIGRLNSDGSLDTGFNPGASWDVSSLAVQADGKILVGGSFSTLGGQERGGIGRLNNTEAAAQNLSYDSSTITWLRGGASPEVWRTTFEYSTNRIDWTSLGAGRRVAGGWQISGVSARSGCILRARGFINGNQSTWYVESLLDSSSMPMPPGGRIK
jgi:uncharacterized delta-60 repeat protein